MLTIRKCSFFNIVFLLCFASISYAQQQGSHSKTTIEPLTLEQYQQCQARSQQSNQQALQLQEQQAELEKMKKQKAELTEQRENLRQTLDLHKLQSVDQYNAVNKKLTDIVNIYESEAKAYNQAVADYKQGISALKQECDDRPYIEKQ